MNIKIGQSLYNVYQRTTSKGGSYSDNIIVTGIVTKIRTNKLGTPAFLQIYNQNLRKGQGYQTQEFFAIKSPLCWCLPCGELKTPIDVSKLF